MTVPVGRPEEVAEKAARLRPLLDRLKLEGIVLRKSSNVAWLTGGRHTHVGLTGEQGVAHALVTADKLYLQTSRIEAPRMEDEEHLRSAGFEFVISNWYEPMASAIDPSPAGRSALMAASSDGVDVSADIAPLRYSLTADEIERFRWVGEKTTLALENTARSIIPGMTEHEIAGQLGGAIVSEGIVTVVCLIATDERIFRYRHPLPMDKRLDRYAMLVRRLKALGPAHLCHPAGLFRHDAGELRRKAEATARIDATFITGDAAGRRALPMFSARRRTPTPLPAIRMNGSFTTRAAPAAIMLATTSAGPAAPRLLSRIRRLPGTLPLPAPSPRILF